MSGAQYTSCDKGCRHADTTMCVCDCHSSGFVPRQRDSTLCGAVCIEATMNCPGAFHCAHGKVCNVVGCLCACHVKTQTEVPVYYFNRSVLFKCCLTYIRDELRYRRAQGKGEPEQGTKIRCIKCGGYCVLRGQTWTDR